MRNRTCPICGEDKANTLQKIQMNIPVEYRLPENYDIIECELCGFVYADTSATKEDYDYYYSNYNVYSECPHDTEGKIERIIELLQIYAEKTSKIINIGTGGGNLERKLVHEGYQNIHSLDISEDNIESLSKLGIDFIIGSVYDEVISLRNAFDILIICDVLEHLLDLENAMENIAAYMKDGAVVVVSVPDCEGLSDAVAPISNSFNHEHINYFSEISLTNLFKKFGFTSISIEKMRITGMGEGQWELIAIYQYTGKGFQKDIFEKDLITGENIVRYIQNYQLFQQKINQKIDLLGREGRSVIVWGTGSFAMNLLSNTNLKNCSIKFFADNNRLKDGKFFSQKPIHLPRKELFEEGDLILLAVMHEVEDIIFQIRNDLNLKNEVISLSNL